jgi:multiple sugar transport system permease protein
MATTTRQRRVEFFNTRRGRVLLENLTAYLFLAPAIILIFLFGIFPVGFAFLVSLYNWRRFPDQYQALGNYERALGNFGYVVFFWLAIGAVAYGLILIRRFWRASQEAQEPQAWLLAIPGVTNAIATLLFFRWFIVLFLGIMNIPRNLLGQQVNLDIFIGEFFAAFRVPEVAEAGNLWLLSAIAAGILTYLFLRRVRATGGTYLAWATLAALFIAGGFLLLQAAIGEIQTAITAAQEDGTELPIWSQVILISVGAALLVGAYWVWRKATQQYDNRRFILLIGGALLLMFGGYLLIAELPNLLAEADRDLITGFNITVMYSIGTVPFQLGIGMLLAFLLFQNIKGKSFFRLVYFLPYITPWVATSIVFKILFSHREASVANQALGVFGIPPQKWLLESTGVNELIFGAGTPEWLVGPSLALIVVMLFTTWTYIGYDAVVFLAGLGNIPSELYESARIDGANRWREFRHITFPLLSPTTFFLSLIAVIGTFKAFTQLWIMRSPASGGSLDTVSIHIFRIVRDTNPRLGYGSALAFVLFAVILILTLVQNRLLARRVFYG